MFRERKVWMAGNDIGSINHLVTKCGIQIREKLFPWLLLLLHERVLGLLEPLVQYDGFLKALASNPIPAPSVTAYRPHETNRRVLSGCIGIIIFMLMTVNMSTPPRPRKPVRS